MRKNWIVTGRRRPLSTAARTNRVVVVVVVRGGGCAVRPMPLQAPVEVVRALLDAHPQGAQRMNNNRDLPLHEAAHYKAPLEVVRALLDAHPQGAQRMACRVQ